MNTRSKFRKNRPSEFPINATKPKSPKKSRWTDQEKENLLKALNKYGYVDIDNICKELPNKTKGAVKLMINKLKQSASTSINTRNCYIDQWLRSGLFSPDTLISQGLKFISLFEKHPKPEECAGCDFRALYDLLSKVTSGHPPIHVSRMTQETICYVMSQANHEVWPFYQKEISDYLENLEEEKTRKCYSRFTKKTLKSEK